MNMNTPQDWTPVVVRKKAPTAADLRDPRTLNAAMRQGMTEAEKKASAAQGKNKHSTGPHGAVAAKLENETEDFHHKRVPSEIRARIVKERTAKHMTQAQLAQAINVPPRIVQDYESGKAIPDGGMLSKMARALGVPSLKK